MKKILSIDELQVSGKRVFVRVDFNVPCDKQTGAILDDTRIKEALPTIQHLIEKQAKIILGTHLGRPKGREERLSLIHVAEKLSALLEKPVVFPEDCVGDAVKKLSHDLREGDVMLLENLRFHKEEEENDPLFAQALSQLADVYVTDAFGTLHRAHASTVGMVSHFREKGMGFLVKRELEALTPLLKEPDKPFIAILGGAKVSDKIGLIESLVAKVDAIFLGGGLAYTFLKAKNAEIGGSRYEAEKITVALRILKKAKEFDVPVHLPTDHTVAEKMEAGVPTENVRRIGPDKKGFDIGVETRKTFTEEILKAKTIFWNGPMGVFEIPEFAKGTQAIAEAFSKSSAHFVIGGGESVAAANKSKLDPAKGHLSTGGGATLEFLEGQELPGIKALH